MNNHLNKSFISMKIKSLLSIVGAAFFSIGTMVSCGPSKAEREEASRQDSIRIADSIAQAEEEARQTAIEAARQDSLARIEKFKQSIPTFREIYLHFAMVENEYTKKINLEKLGFVKKTKTKEYIPEFDILLTEDTYRLELDPERFCLIVQDNGSGSKLSFKIVGFPDLMEKYKDEAKALKSSPDFAKYSVAYEGPTMDIKKDEIFWEDGV